MKEFKKTHSIEFKAIKGDDLTITPSGDDFIVEGWAMTYGNIDNGNDICVKGCAGKTLQDMGPRISLCYQHDMRNPIGKPEFTDKEQGLWMKARISDAEPNIKTKVKEGILKEFSIGFQTINANYKTVDAKEVREITEIKLYEVSLVTLAMNSQAQMVEHTKSEMGIETKDDLEELFDKLIVNESNTIKKHDLMILKGISLSMVEPVIPLKPIEPESKESLVDYMKQNFKLLNHGR